MSTRTKDKNHYAVHFVGSIVGIVALAVILLAGSVFLAYYLKWGSKVILTVSCIAVSVLLIVLATGSGSRLCRDALVFYREKDSDRLFVIDVREMSGYRRGFLGQAETAVKIQKNLEKIKKGAEEYGIMPSGGTEILRVHNIRERMGDYALVCEVGFGNGQKGKHTYFVGKGYENEEGLFHILERKKVWENPELVKENKSWIQMLISVFVFIICTAVCVMSHPWIAELPEVIYFPSLGLTMVSLTIMLYFIIKYRRGE